MFKNLIEYREMQQLRKDHLNQQKRRQAIVLFGRHRGSYGQGAGQARYGGGTCHNDQASAHRRHLDVDEHSA
jgi:hypothetical protein